MSLILDALRKMEKGRKLRRESAASLRPQVLSYRGQLSRSGGHYKLYLWTGLVILFLAGGATIYLHVHAPAVPVKAQSVPPPAAPAIIVPELPPVPLQPSAAVVPQPLSAAPVPPAKLSDKTPVEPQTAAPTDSALVISGIAWQDERQLRRAVINGSLVGEGAEIAGAKVIEIREYLIRFSRNGRSFEIPFSAGSKGR